MPAVHVRNVPEEVLDALKRRAEAHHRSLNGEILEILDRAANQTPAGQPPGPLRLTLARTEGAQTWSRQGIYDDDER